MTNKNFVTLVLCVAAAACSEKTAPPAKAPAPAEAPKPAETPKPAEAPQPPEQPKPPEPEPAPAPAARATKDAKGHDWASHMGDIAFTFDSSAAAGRSEKEGRALMLFFTTPT